MSWLVDAAAIFWREVLRYRRDRAYWIGQIVFPVVFVGVVGAGLNNATETPTRADYIAYLASGALALVVGSGAVGAGFSLIEDRESGFLRALLVAPVTSQGIVLGKLAARLLVSLVLVAVLTGVFSLVTPLRLAHPLALVFAVAAVTAVFTALGILLATRLRRLESFRMVSALVTIPLYLFAGIFFPLSQLSGPMRWLAYADPLTYAVDLFRFGVLGEHELPLAFSTPALALLTAGALWAAVQAFDRRVRA